MSVEDNTDGVFRSLLSGLLPTGALSTAYNYAGMHNTSGMQNLSFMFVGMPVSVAVTSLGAFAMAVALLNKDLFNKNLFGAGVIASGVALGVFNAVTSPSNAFDRVQVDTPPIMQLDERIADISLLEGPE